MRIWRALESRQLFFNRTKTGQRSKPWGRRSTTNGALSAHGAGRCEALVGRWWVGPCDIRGHIGRSIALHRIDTRGARHANGGAAGQDHAARSHAKLRHRELLASAILPGCRRIVTHDDATLRVAVGEQGVPEGLCQTGHRTAGLREGGSEACFLPARSIDRLGLSKTKEVQGAEPIGGRMPSCTWMCTSEHAKAQQSNKFLGDRHVTCGLVELRGSSPRSFATPYELGCPDNFWLREYVIWVRNWVRAQTTSVVAWPISSIYATRPTRATTPRSPCQPS